MKNKIFNALLGATLGSLCGLCSLYSQQLREIPSINDVPHIIESDVESKEQIVSDFYAETNEEVEEEERMVIMEDLANPQNEYFAKCVYAEAGDQDELGKRLVIDVILNRVKSDKFPDSIVEVIDQEHQFEVVSNGRIYDAPVDDDILRLIEEEEQEQINYEVIYFCMYDYFSWATPVLHHQDHYFCK